MINPTGELRRQTTNGLSMIQHCVRILLQTSIYNACLESNYMRDNKVHVIYDYMLNSNYDFTVIDESFYDNNDG